MRCVRTGSARGAWAGSTTVMSSVSSTSVTIEITVSLWCGAVCEGLVRVVCACAPCARKALARLCVRVSHVRAVSVGWLYHVRAARLSGHERAATGCRLDSARATDERTSSAEREARGAMDYPFLSLVCVTYMLMRDESEETLCRESKMKRGIKFLHRTH